MGEEDKTFLLLFRMLMFLFLFSSVGLKRIALRLELSQDPFQFIKKQIILTHTISTQ